MGRLRSPAAVAVAAVVVLLVGVVRVGTAREPAGTGAADVLAGPGPTTGPTVEPTTGPTIGPAAGTPTASTRPTQPSPPTSLSPGPAVAATEPPPATTPSPAVPGSPAVVTLDLEAPARARVGDRVRLVGTVRNAGPGPAYLMTGDCAGTFLSIGVTPGFGDVPPARVSGDLLAFRESVLSQRQLPDGVYGPDPGGCPVTPPLRLDPGESYTEGRTWVPASMNGSAYTGAVPVEALVTFSGTPAQLSTDPDRQPYRSADARTLVSLTGGDPDRMSPVEALDLALDDPSFASLVEQAGPPPYPEQTGSVALQDAGTPPARYSVLCNSRVATVDTVTREVRLLPPSGLA